MNRVYFGAGPAELPPSVLDEIQSELRDWKGTQLSILEIGHRTTQFEQTMGELEDLFRSLLNIPKQYLVLFMGCPTRMHFSLIPMHFVSKGQQAGYWITGHWSAIAFEEAKKCAGAYPIATAVSFESGQMPAAREWLVQANTAYTYFTPNETIDGVRFYPPIEHLVDGAKPLIADMTSCLLTEQIAVTDYAMIFAGTQKNLGIAGLSVVVIAQDFLSQSKQETLPTYLDYRTYAQSHSLCVTPPVFQCEVMLKMLKWVKAQGGLAVLSDLNAKKAKRLYDYLDSTDFYQTTVDKAARSQVNVTFHLRDRHLEPQFFKEANAHGLLGLEGHRTKGGMRASLYNAIPIEGVQRLVQFMKNFEDRA